LDVLREETDARARLVPLAERVEAESRRQAQSNTPERTIDASLDGLERLVSDPPRSDGYFDLPRWTERATRADRAEAWRRLLAEKDPRRLASRLVAWRRRGPPNLHPRLFQLVRHADRRVRRFAVAVLETVKHPRVRTWALRRLRDDPVHALDDRVLDLFRRSGCDSDAAAIRAALPRRGSREIKHDWALGVRGLAREHPSRAWTPLLVRAIELSQCRECRRTSLDLLVRLGAAPRAMLEEALHDADSDARKTARDALRKLRR
jgi:hypothetical protein